MHIKNIPKILKIIFRTTLQKHILRHYNLKYEEDVYKENIPKILYFIFRKMHKKKHSKNSINYI